jgi:hypothetical protein
VNQISRLDLTIAYLFCHLRGIGTNQPVLSHRSSVITVLVARKRVSLECHLSYCTLEPYYALPIIMPSESLDFIQSNQLQAIAQSLACSNAQVQELKQQVEFVNEQLTKCHDQGGVDAGLTSSTAKTKEVQTASSSATTSLLSRSPHCSLIPNH